jgi:hypothetical protein
MPQFADGTIPPPATETYVYIYESNFATRTAWEAAGTVEPEEFRNPQRPRYAANYIIDDPERHGLDCVPDPACNPHHFSGEDVMLEKHTTTEQCAPTLTRLRVAFGEDGLRTLEKSWFFFPYAKYNYMFQAENVDLDIQRRPTGLCQGDTWPCVGFEGRLRVVLRGVELHAPIHKVLEGGFSEDAVWALLGAPDVDLDGDGAEDSYSLQFDIDLTPVHFRAGVD